MKKYILLLLCSFMCISVSAQVDSFYKGTTFTITGGIAIPGSEFADATGIEVNDYVDRGIYASVGFKIDVFKHFALGATGGYSKNNLNTAAIEEASNTRIESRAWTSTFLLLDFYAQVPIKKWTPYVRVSPGAMFPNDWNFYAEQEHTNGAFLKGTTSTADKVELAYLAGLGLSYTANRFVIGIESNILAYEPQFKIDLNGSPGTRDQWIATLNQTFSVGYKF